MPADFKQPEVFAAIQLSPQSSTEGAVLGLPEDAPSLAPFDSIIFADALAFVDAPQPPPS